MTRAYVPLDVTGLRALRDTGQLATEHAYAVTSALRESYAESGITEEEDLEYVAMTVAARVSLTLLDPEKPDDRRRIVVAVDAPAEPGTGHPARVRLEAAVPLAGVASVHVDTDDVRPVVDAAVQALPAAADGEPAARRLVDSLDEEDLAWFAVQELPDLLGS